MFSIQAIWDDTLTFLKREAGLVFPLALATLGLGNVVVALAQSTTNGGANAAAVGPQFIALFAALLMLVGKLALITLALPQRRSVGEALRHGAARLGKYLLFIIALSIALLILVLPLLPHLAGQLPALVHKNWSNINMEPWETLWLCVILGLVIWVSIRLFALEPLMVDKQMSLWEMAKESFALTRGCFWKLFLFMIGFLLFSLVVSAAVTVTFGSLATIIGKMLSSPLSGTILTALAQSAAAAVLGSVGAVFAAKAYLRLTSARQTDVIAGEQKPPALDK